MLILDSGAVSRLAERTREMAALLRALREAGMWPPIVPSIVLVECLQGHAGRDATANRFLKSCDIAETLAWPGTVRLMRRHWRPATPQEGAELLTSR